MKWEKFEEGHSMPIKSWCENCEEGAVSQAENLAKHPALFHHVALMPDAHQGCGYRICNRRGARPCRAFGPSCAAGVIEGVEREISLPPHLY